jgi:hypothetical protein
MTTKLTRPYTIFYPVIARDGMPFPINKCVREIQQGRGLIGNQWRGDLVVAAYSDAYAKGHHYISSVIDVEMQNLHRSRSREDERLPHHQELFHDQHVTGQGNFGPSCVHHYTLFISILQGT